jgi:hypothetical protein
MRVLAHLAVSALAVAGPAYMVLTLASSLGIGG